MDATSFNTNYVRFLDGVSRFPHGFWETVATVTPGGVPALAVAAVRALYSAHCRDIEGAPVPRRAETRARQRKRATSN
eukprot:8877300-Pyramimonas_sp.AAC.1